MGLRDLAACRMVDFVTSYTDDTTVWRAEVAFLVVVGLLGDFDVWSLGDFDVWSLGDFDVWSDGLADLLPKYR